jgi:ferredoxin-NADP reductase
MVTLGASSDTRMTEVLTTTGPGVQWQTAVVKDIVARTARIKSFVLAPSRPFKFLAGQHVNVRLTAPDGYHAMRSYSIASPPEETSRIELAIEHLEDGEVSPFFHEVVQVEDQIEFRGPLGGHFVWSKADGGPLLLIGGGSGLVPLMAIIRHREAVAQDVPIVLLLSARDWEDVLYRDELLALHARRDGFTLVLTLTRGPPKRDIDYGRRVDPPMMAEVLCRLPGPPRHVFVCGTNPFANAAADGAIAAGTPASIIRTERYGGLM